MENQNAQGLTDTQITVLRAFARALGQETHVLTRYPALLWQQMYNRLQWEEEAVREAIWPEFVRRTTHPPRPWAHNLILPRESKPILMTLIGHTGAVKSVAFSPDGRKIISASTDRTIKIWDSKTGKEIRSLTGHTDDVVSVSFSPDGRSIVSGSFDGTIKIWDSETGEDLMTLTGHTNRIHSVAFSPDGKQVVSGSADGTIKIWDARRGKAIQTITTSHMHGVLDCAISPDGKCIVSTGYWTLSVWDTRSGEMLETIAGFEKSVRCCAFSPDGNSIISSGFDPAIKIRDTKTRYMVAEISTEHALPVNACAYSPDGRRIASSSDDKTIKIWDVETGEEMQILIGHTGPVYSVAFSPDGKYIVSASEDGTLKIWDVVARGEKHGGQMAGMLTCEILDLDRVVATGEEPKSEEQISHYTSVKKCTFSPDGKRIFSFSDDSLFIWDTETGKKSQTIFTRKVDPWLDSIACDFSQDGERIVFSLYDNLRVWVESNGVFSLYQSLWLDLHRHHEQKNKQKKRIIVCAFSPDGKRIASGYEDGTLKIWNSTPSTLIQRLILFIVYTMWDNRIRWKALPLSGHTSAVTICAFSPDGKRIISVGHELKLWDAGTGKEIASLARYTGWIKSAAFSPDGKRIALASGDGTLIWDAEAGQEVKTISSHRCVTTSVSFSPHGKRIASGSWNGAIKLWNAETGEEIQTLTGHIGSVEAVAFSPDERRIVSASADKTVRLWNAETGEEILMYPALGPVNCCAFSPLGDRVCCGDDGGNVYLLKLFGLDKDSSLPYGLESDEISPVPAEPVFVIRKSDQRKGLILCIAGLVFSVLLGYGLTRLNPWLWIGAVPLIVMMAAFGWLMLRYPIAWVSCPHCHRLILLFTNVKTQQCEHCKRDFILE